MPKGALFVSTMTSSGLAGRTETFVRYGLTRRLEVGFGYLWDPGIVRPLASYTLLPETRDRPSLTAGLMFDSLGGGRQGVFVSAAKIVGRAHGLPISGYVGGAQITNEDDPRFIAGVSLPLCRRVIASVQYDGRFFHPGLSARVGQVAGAPMYLGMVAARGNRLGPLLAVRAPLGRSH